MHHSDELLADWKAAVDPDDERWVDVRTTTRELVSVGLSAEEALLVALRRTANGDTASEAFAASLLTTPVETTDEEEDRGDLGRMLPFAVASGLVMWLGVREGEDLLFLNLGPLVLGVLAAYLGWRRRISSRTAATIAGSLVALVGVSNLYPFEEYGQTMILTIISTAALVVTLVGVAWAGGDWRSHAARLGFVGFAGESVILFVLIGLGAGPLLGLTVVLFGIADFDVGEFVGTELFPFGMGGAVIVAAWFVLRRALRGVPSVLAAVFTPLATLMVVAGLVAAFIGGVGADRESLIAFDAVLVIVVFLLLFGEAVGTSERSRWVDLTRTVLVGAALLLDLFGLAAMVSRIVDYGLTPNKAAALGLNVLLFITLSMSVRILLRRTTGREVTRDLADQLVMTLPAYVAWAAIVAVVFPLVFGFA